MPLAVDSRGSTSRAEDTSLRLLNRTAFEPQYELEKALLASFVRLQDVLGLGSEKAMHAALQERIGESAAQLGEAMNGLLFGILVDVQAAGKYLNCINFITRDGWVSSLAILQCLVTEKYSKLLEGVRAQILWLLRQLVVLGVGDLEVFFLDLLRQIAGGDLSHSNVWLAATLLEIFQSNLPWLYASQSLLTSVLYTYLRILPDHAMARNSALNDLRQSEAILCAQILREKFSECMTIGRDLVRLLRDVSSMPEFDSVWKDLHTDAAAFNTPSFADLAQLYLARTPARFIASRVTPDMEAQLRFMLSHVRMGNQRRYQTWFAQRFLSAPESETLVPDLVRFICCCVHPTNQILRSEVLPRWAILGWLLKCCKSGNVEASAKLALLYDWLFFATKSDNIMNIEPAILLMVHSIPKYADMTNSLLDFLFLLIEHYDNQRRELLQRGVTASIDILVGKGVVHSLEPLSASPLVAPGLREKLITRFPAHCKAELSPPALDTRPQPVTESPPTTSTQILAIPSKSATPPTSTSDPATAAAVLPGSGPAEGTVVEMESAGTVAERKALAADNLRKGAAGNSLSSVPKKRKRVAAERDTAALVRSAVEKFRDAMSGRSQEAPAGALERLLALYLRKSQMAESCLSSGSAEPGEVSSGADAGAREVSEATAVDSSAAANGLVDLSVASGKGLESVAHALEDLSAEEEGVLFADLVEDPAADPPGKRSMTTAILEMYVVNPKVEPMLLRWHRKGLPVRARLLCWAVEAANRVVEKEELTHGKLSASKRSLQLDESIKAVEIAAAEEDEEKEDGLVVHVGDGSDEEGELVEREDEERGQEGQRGAMDVSEGSDEVEERVRSGGKAECSTAGRSPTKEKSGSLCDGGKSCCKPQGESDQARAAESLKAFAAYEGLLRSSCGGVDSEVPRVEGGSGNGGVSGSRVSAESVGGGVGEGMKAMVAGLVCDLRTLFLWNKSRMIWALPWVFKHLPELSCCNIAIFQLLLASADPFELYDLELRISLGELTMVGPAGDSALVALVSDSLAWDSAEQHALWQLLGAEVKAGLSAPPLALRLLTMASQQVDLSGTPEAAGGLLRLLNSVEPSAELLNVLLELPAEYGKLSAAVLAGWAMSNKAPLRILVRQHLHAAPLGDGRAPIRNGGSLPGACMLRLLALVDRAGDAETAHPEGLGEEDRGKDKRGGERGESSEGGGQGDVPGKEGLEAVVGETRSRKHAGELIKAVPEQRRVEHVAPRETRSRVLRSNS